MNMRGFLAWYLGGTVFVAAAGASAVYGVKQQQAVRAIAAITPRVAPVPDAPRQAVAQADIVPAPPAPPTVLPLPPAPAAASRVPPLREHVTAQAGAKSSPKRIIVAKAPPRPAPQHRSTTVASAPPPGAYGAWAPPRMYSAPPPPPPSPYYASSPYYAYRVYGAYGPGYYGWPRVPYYPAF